MSTRNLVCLLNSLTCLVREDRLPLTCLVTSRGRLPSLTSEVSRQFPLTTLPSDPKECASGGIIVYKITAAFRINSVLGIKTDKEPIGPRKKVAEGA
ncbi:unnamed protein product [Arabidopsis thaliana]|uniref:Uncharacterized protein n=1 Tax=Arabidopsis thaliana TaxID=3702 RepID=A0A654GFF4_ARATH|nr:unnamed protein product [Arabidopsis thaliana]VYS71757.1 unnamed protein product [Arabidopsis thaliana]